MPNQITVYPPLRNFYPLTYRRDPLIYIMRFVRAGGDKHKRLEILEQCFYENIKQAYPFGVFNRFDYQFESYDLIARHIDHETPQPFLSEVINTFLDLSYPHTYQWNTPEEKSHSTKTLFNALHTANRLKSLMTSSQLKQLIECAVKIKEFAQTENKLVALSDDVTRACQLVAVAIDRESFHAAVKQFSSRPTCWSIRKFQLASSIYFSSARIEGDVIDMPYAFQLFSEIVEWEPEYGEARFIMAMIVSGESNFTPESFAHETSADRKERHLVMRPYLIQSADAGFLEARIMLQELDQSICLSVFPHLNLNFFSPKSATLSSHNVFFFVAHSPQPGFKR